MPTLGIGFSLLMCKIRENKVESSKHSSRLLWHSARQSSPYCSCFNLRFDTSCLFISVVSWFRSSKQSLLLQYILLPQFEVILKVRFSHGNIMKGIIFHSMFSQENSFKKARWMLHLSYQPDFWNLATSSFCTGSIWATFTIYRSLEGTCYEIFKLRNLTIHAILSPLFYL